jgi:hypothetical protein
MTGRNSSALGIGLDITPLGGVVWLGSRGRFGRRSLVASATRGKSELQRAGCWLTASQGDLQESATENIPPFSRGLRASGTR